MRPGLADEDLVRAVVDANVLISGALSPQGAPAEILRGCRDGAFEMIVSELLIAELTRALSYPKLGKWVPAEKAAAFIGWVREQATVADDPPDQPPVHSPDPEDDYLLGLAVSVRSFLVTGDHHLLSLADDLPILTPAEFATYLDPSG
jgi:uncharacterized protein